MGTEYDLSQIVGALWFHVGAQTAFAVWRILTAKEGK